MKWYYPKVTFFKRYVSQTHVSQQHGPQSPKTNVRRELFMFCLQRIVSCKRKAIASTIGGFSSFSFKQHLSFLEVFDFPQHKFQRFIFCPHQYHDVAKSNCASKDLFMADLAFAMEGKSVILRFLGLA